MFHGRKVWAPGVDMRRYGSGGVESKQVDDRDTFRVIDEKRRARSKSSFHSLRSRGLVQLSVGDNTMKSDREWLPSHCVGA